MEDITLADTISAVANAPAKSPADKPQGTAGPATSEKILARILSSLEDDKAEDVVQVSLSGKSDMADHMVIASGRSTRQVAAMAQKLAEKVKQAGFGPARVEGLPTADWVLIDAGDVVVHLFRPEVRSFYNLERMWSFESGEAAVS